jgi:selenide,water dikinase
VAARAIAKAGAQVGDVLILTKPLGSGTIMAAEMATAVVPGLILGEAVATALTQMCRPNGAAAAVLAPVAHAMTDVTGFGLAGHLLEILDASGCAAELQLAAIPTLPGALALAQAGHSSSLAPANRAATIGRVMGADSAAKALLYDPQTAGGLLAAVPEDQAAEVVAALRAGGDAAAIIGRVVTGPARIVPG